MPSDNEPAYVDCIWQASSIEKNAHGEYLWLLGTAPLAQRLLAAYQRLLDKRLDFAIRLKICDGLVDTRQ